MTAPFDLSRFVADQRPRAIAANTLFDVHEMLSALHDPVFFANQTTVPTVTGRPRFIAYPHQDTLLRHCVTHRFSVVLKARQIGMSTCLARLALWRASMENHKTILVLSYRAQTAYDLLDRVRDAHASLPAHLRAEIIEDTRSRIYFDNGSTIFGGACNGDAGRSMTVSHVLIDDAAQVRPRDLEAYLTGWYPVHSTNPTLTVVIASTPGPAQGPFYDLWQEAGKNAYAPLRLDYTRAPNPNLDYAEMRRLLGETSFNQEFGCQFAPPR